jgi:hypothetical protein
MKVAISFENTLQGIVAGLGAVAIATGLLALVGGANALPGEEAASATTESALRFYACFWIAYGVVALRVAPHAVRETLIVRGIALVMFLGGIGRALAWIAEGQPHALFVVLMVVELVGAPLLIAWQAKARDSQAGSVAA